MKSSSDIRTKIFALAKRHSAVIGLGSALNTDAIFSSRTYAKRAGLVKKIELFGSASELIKALSVGEIDAAVRGNLDARDMVYELKRVFGVSGTMRAALLEVFGRPIFLAPVGIDECRSVDEKVQLVKCLQPLMKKLSLSPEVGVLAKCRKEDEGRMRFATRWLRETECVVKRLNAENIPAHNCEILLERAVNEANIILVPDGVSGNLLFRAFHLVCGYEAFGAPVVNIDKLFIDTSRSRTSYVSAIALAAALAK